MGLQILDVFRNHADTVAVVAGEIGVDQVPRDKLGFVFPAAAMAQDLGGDDAKWFFFDVHAQSSATRGSSVHG